MKFNMVVPILIFLLVILLAFVLITFNNKSVLSNSERFYTNGVDTSAPTWSASSGVLPKPNSNSSVATNSPSNPDAAAGLGSPYAPSDVNNEEYNAVFSGVGTVGGGSAAASGSSCYPRDRLTTADLLPKDAADSRWAQMNPSGQGDVNNQNYLQAGFHVGINTQGQTMRNANLQLRSDPPNPQLAVSPWNVSTIEYDGNRKHFEIGE